MDGRIPIVVGVTGHRNLRDKDITALKAAVKSELDSLRAKCPHSEIIVMTGAAEGADILCAETALEMGLGTVSVLPMPVEEYEKDFDPDSGRQEVLHNLIAKSDKVLIAPFIEPYTEGRDYLYRQAGLYIAKHSHCMLSLWDGVEGDPAGCGTASITDVKITTSYDEAAGRQLHPADGVVVQIVTPRDTEDIDIQDPEEAGHIVMHGSKDTLDRILAATDAYNRDCLRMQASEAGKTSAGDASGAEAPADDGATEDGADDAKQADPVMEKIDAVYYASDKMSVMNAERHRKSLAAMSVFATFLALAFLLYDEVEWTWMMLVCGIIIVLLFTINALNGRLSSQRKYLEYRILAETMRVQTYMRTAGIDCEVSDILPWSLQVSIPWVRHAVPAVNIGIPAAEKNSILECWVIDQKEYHKRALARTEAQLKNNDRIVRAALVLTLFIYVSALIFEIGWGGMLGREALVTGASAAYVRLFIKIAMGTFSCGTLFAGNYYGKQALPDVMDDHRKMILLYEEAEREIMANGERELLLIRLAENELNENSNWYAYQSKHEPELAI